MQNELGGGAAVLYYSFCDSRNFGSLKRVQLLTKDASHVQTFFLLTPLQFIPYTTA